MSDSAARPLPFWPVFIFIGLGTVGMIGFLVAIYAPHRLPGRSAAERELERNIQKELELEGRKANVRRMKNFFSPPAPDYDQRDFTNALNRHSDELRLQRDVKDGRSDDSENGGGSA